MEDLLNKAFWNNKDIQAYANVGVNKASKIRKIAILKYDGFIKLLPQKVKRDAVLKALEELRWKT